MYYYYYDKHRLTYLTSSYPHILIECIHIPTKDQIDILTFERLETISKSTCLFQALHDVLLRLHGDNVLVEELLQLLVALVNSDLLKIFISNPAM